MAKTSALPLKDFEQTTPSSRNPEQIDAFHRAEPKSLRWMFAQSICKANNIATKKERSACNDGVPCTKLHNCTELADTTIRYLDSRKTNAS